MLINQMNIAMQSIAFEAQRLQNMAHMLTNNAATLPSQSQPPELAPAQSNARQVQNSKGQIINITV